MEPKITNLTNITIYLSFHSQERDIDTDIEEYIWKLEASVEEKIIR